nr:ribonuclease H-like domain-containing protein [Tanacetum cinerariifolium]
MVSDHRLRTLNKKNPNPTQDLLVKEKIESQLETTQTMSALKLLVLKTGEYNLWSMRIEQYLTFTDHALWEVIINGDSVSLAASASVGAEDNSSNTNETVNTAHSVSAASSKDQASTASYVDDVMFSFFSNQLNASQLDNKDLEQIDTNDLEEMDLKAPRNQENRNRDAPTRNAPVDTSTTNALVIQDGIGGYDWSF